MRKFIGFVLLLLFAFSVYFSVSGDIATNSNNSTGYASIVPIPPDSPKLNRGY